ncbi:23S rRNA pseudouridine(1911/1915/1917) synthase RluD [Rhodocyclus tenuis]|uniref:Ribosomal large subunit pseudouridine synthase D n=2 Tax=Rhodocyclus TaxID=1064 RepID=A0A6L5JUT8_RHOTE|nr:23S rRNA pseudouridine(1911/1915/1917) synthase RluD [Rhodocyclus gracilis]
MSIPQKKTPMNSASGRGDYSASVPLSLIVPSDCGGERLDRILARLLPQHSRNRLQGWIRDGRVRLGSETLTETRRRLWGGETLVVDAVEEVCSESATAENIPLSVIYEDDSLLVIDKPAGLVVHPGNGNWNGTLLNALLHYSPALAAVPRGGIVHRLDKDTSGLLVVARTLAAQTDLVRQLQARTVKRRYRALVRGECERDGMVDAPIGRHPTQRTKMAVVRGGKPARTHYRILERFIGCTLVECALETGRTHQIRVHMASIGHPLVGDPVYGGGASRIPVGAVFHRQALHAWRLGLVHPVTGRTMQWTSPIPEDFAGLLDDLRAAAEAAQAAIDAAQADEFDDDWDEGDGPQVFYVRGDEYEEGEEGDYDEGCDVAGDEAEGADGEESFVEDDDEAFDELVSDDELHDECVDEGESAALTSLATEDDSAPSDGGALARKRSRRG